MDFEKRDVNANDFRENEKTTFNKVKKHGIFLAREATKSGKEFVNDVKDYKNLSEKRKKKLWIGGGLIAIFLIFIVALLKGCAGDGNPSQKEIEKNALLCAQQEEFEYKLTFDSCKIVEKIKKKLPVYGGKERTASVYGVLLTADVNDESGDILIEDFQYPIILYYWGENKGMDPFYMSHSLGRAGDEMTEEEITNVIKEEVERIKKF